MRKCCQNGCLELQEYILGARIFEEIVYLDVIVEMYSRMKHDSNKVHSNHLNIFLHIQQFLSSSETRDDPSENCEASAEALIFYLYRRIAVGKSLSENKFPTPPLALKPQSIPSIPI